MNMHTISLRKFIVGLSVLVLSGFSGYQLIRTGIAHAATTPCIITVFGNQYDVTALQTSHSGGNIFVCGTDMTATFQSMHGTDVSRIAQYLVVSTTPTPTLTPAPTSTGTPAPTPTMSPIATITPTPSPTGTPVVHADGDEQEAESEREEPENEREEEHGSIGTGITVRTESEHSGDTTLKQNVKLNTVVRLTDDHDDE